MPAISMESDSILEAPLAVFTSRQNSHPFQERHISVHEPHKIGRSVARAHPAPSNAIFDCKVLSRNHALLWFEDNKFYLQDTKSSNGTFVNNQRLSKGSEESDPHELFSGDIIQFGVDVMENSKRVTHGCIMASVTLYLPDGTEAKPRYSSQNQNGLQAMTTVHSQEIYQLSQYLQEAMHREQVLEEKLAHLQNLVHKSGDSCESGWQALINEDRLLSKLEVVQNQLAACRKNQTESSLQQQIVNMEEERLNYETSAKQSLRKVLQEKLSAVQELSELERTLANAEQECKHLRTVQQDTQEELMELSQKHDKKLAEINLLNEQLGEAERVHHSEVSQYEQEAELLQAKLEAAMAEKDSLEAKVVHLTQCKESLEKSLQLSSQAQESVANEGTTMVNGNHTEHQSNGGDNSIVIANPVDSTDAKSFDGEEEKLSYETLTTDLNLAQDKIESLQDELMEKEQSLAESEKEVTRLQIQIDQVQLEVVEYVTKVATLEEKLKTSETERLSVIEHAKSELEEKRITSEKVIQLLTEEVESLKKEREEADKESVKKLHEDLSEAQQCSNDLQMKIESIQDALTTEKQSSAKKSERNNSLQAELLETKAQMEKQSQTALQYKEQSIELHDKLEDALKKSQEASDRSESEKQAILDKAKTDKEEFAAIVSECCTLRNRIQAVETDLKRAQQENEKLTKEVGQWKTENLELSEKVASLTESSKELTLTNEGLVATKEEIMTNLTDAQKQTSRAQEENAKAQTDKEALNSQYKVAIEELEATKSKLTEADQQHSNMKEELDKLRNQLESVTQEYGQLSERSKALSLFSTLPLMVLVFAVVMALYPFLSRVTATTDGPGS